MSVAIKNDASYICMNSDEKIFLRDKPFYWNIKMVKGSKNRFYIYHHDRYVCAGQKTGIVSLCKTPRTSWLIDGTKGTLIEDFSGGDVLDVWSPNEGPLKLYRKLPKKKGGNQRFDILTRSELEQDSLQEEQGVQTIQPKKSAEESTIVVYSFNIRIDNTLENHIYIFNDVVGKCNAGAYDVICLQECPPWLSEMIKGDKTVLKKYEIRSSHSETLIVKKKLKPVFNKTLFSKDMKTSEVFSYLKARQIRPFLSVYLSSCDVTVGTSHFWSVFEELSGRYESVDEKIHAISQCFAFMKDGVKKDTTTYIIAADTNLMEDGHKMESREMEQLSKNEIFDLARENEQRVVTWDGYKNNEQIHHSERHRPDRVLASRILDADVTVIESNISDHYAISAVISI